MLIAEALPSTVSLYSLTYSSNPAYGIRIMCPTFRQKYSGVMVAGREYASQSFSEAELALRITT